MRAKVSVCEEKEIEISDKQVEEIVKMFLRQRFNLPEEYKVIGEDLYEEIETWGHKSGYDTKLLKRATKEQKAVSYLLKYI